MGSRKRSDLREQLILIHTLVARLNIPQYTYQEISHQILIAKGMAIEIETEEKKKRIAKGKE